MTDEEEKEKRKEEAGMKRALKRGSDDGSYRKMLKAIRSGHSAGQMLRASSLDLFHVPSPQLGPRALYSRPSTDPDRAGAGLFAIGVLSDASFYAEA